MYRPTSPILRLIGIWDIRITGKRNNFSKVNFTDVDVKIPIFFLSTSAKDTPHISDKVFYIFLLVIKGSISLLVM